ncbi:ATP synthase protein I [Bisgaardia hudsonensis]|uniref:ATP synthase protein I n=1 Tax=Bisgaardia hudsonensis TaxID=109472 RepID=A0A4R2MZU5_9PAST|nr:hypothetical protein A6A11_00160 [Bisgaardia hudsonensis]TCP11493.1 ATP synthase protein I [Bisgaardia hudsonensis]
MSIVIKKTQEKYKLILTFQVVVFVITLGIYFLWQNSLILSFFLGGISVFLPYCLFVLFVFFSKQSTVNPLKKLYLGELIKFVVTILLIIIILKFFSVDTITFFMGYIVSILLNNLLPFLVKRN